MFGRGTPSTAKAQNVILVIGDGVGIPTLSAASIHGYGEPLRLFIQQMPHIGLSETSAADDWVSDSAAGMTAIMTGRKTNNGVVSQAPDAVRGEKDGAPLKTILEYAEERGLATGLVSNSPMADATPAACYAHVNDRDKTGEIFAQLLQPRFGDGVDVVIGPGYRRIKEATSALGLDLEAGLAAAGYVLAGDETQAAAAAESAHRLVALYSSGFDLGRSVETALDILVRQPQGFFLMVESNNHSTDVKATLDGTVAMDRLVQQIVTRMRDTPTLVLFTADHSYGISLPGAKRGETILPAVTAVDTHTGEEVLVAASGPGSEVVRGIFPNTRLFEIMMAAYGWQ